MKSVRELHRKKLYVAITNAEKYSLPSVIAVGGQLI